MIKDRVIQYVEYKKIKKEYFFKKIGMTSANFRGEAKKTPINSTAIENIFTSFPDINIEWLITGEGEMIKTESSESTIIYKSDPRDLELIASNKETIEIQKKLIASLEQRIKELERDSSFVKSSGFHSVQSVDTTSPKHSGPKVK